MLRVYSPTAAPHLPAVTIRTFLLLVFLPLVHLFHLLLPIVNIMVMIIMEIITIWDILITNACVRNSSNKSNDVSWCNTVYIHIDICHVNTLIVEINWKIGFLFASWFKFLASPSSWRQLCKADYCMKSTFVIMIIDENPTSPFNYFDQ